ncbi:MAG: hypothetical protein JSS35_15605 [Proteobacteria bacterium]|nr:hypothetical protein [Pseudomonadota bacterium]
MTLRSFPTRAAFGRSSLAALALCVLTACGGKPPVAAEGEAAPQVSYVSPPRVEAVRPAPSGVILLGSAPPGGQVRLATPAGQAQFAAADAAGRWSVVLPPASTARIFGLSAVVRGRPVQAEGYLLVTPTGQAALLRAGASAVRVDPPSQRGLRSVDFDRGGGMEITAQTAPGATVTVQMDGRQIAQGRADATGRYGVSLGGQTPVRPGTHHIELFGDGYVLIDQATVAVTPAAPLAEGPLRSQLTPAGLRVDWMTPGGGVQSTLLIH